MGEHEHCRNPDTKRMKFPYPIFSSIRIFCNPLSKYSGSGFRVSTISSLAMINLKEVAKSSMVPYMTVLSPADRVPTLPPKAQRALLGGTDGSIKLSFCICFRKSSSIVPGCTTASSPTDSTRLKYFLKFKMIPVPTPVP